MPSESDLKPALTVEKQLELLETKGLIIDNLEQSKLFITDNNYYRLNIYFHKLMDDQDHFKSNTKFSKIIAICMNDCYLRKQIFSMLEPIEIKLKTRIAYYIGCKYGPSAFYKKEIYKSAQCFDQIMQTFLRDISYEAKNPIILHHYKNYSGYFPIWVIVEFLSFHKISKYFENLLSEDQKVIAINSFGINENLLISWIHSLSVMRNICAHYGYLYKRKYAISISFGNDSSNYQNMENTLFGVFYCIKKLSEIDQWKKFQDSIYSKVSEETLISDYDFPSDLSILKTG